MQKFYEALNLHLQWFAALIKLPFKVNAVGEKSLMIFKTFMVIITDEEGQSVEN